MMSALVVVCCSPHQSEAIPVGYRNVCVDAFPARVCTPGAMLYNLNSANHLEPTGSHVFVFKKRRIYKHKDFNNAEG